MKKDEKDEKDEIKFWIAATLSLFATIAFVVWAFIALKDGADAFYAAVSLVASPLIWLVSFMIFGRLIVFLKNDK